MRNPDGPGFYLLDEIGVDVDNRDFHNTIYRPMVPVAFRLKKDRGV